MVAKRFFNCGNGVGEVSTAENESFLVAEITRIKSISWLLGQFKAEASSKGVDISQGRNQLLFISSTVSLTA